MKTQLAIEISENGVNFAHIQDGSVVSIDSFTFKDKIDYRYKEQLEQIFSEKGYKEKEYDEYSLSWYSIQSTLLPNNVFSETKPEDLFRLCYSQDIPADHIDYNRIPELSIVNVYQIPQWVKSFFIVKFPRIIIQHEGSHLLHGIFAGSTFKLSSYITLHDNSFSLIITSTNDLQFYSQFEFQSIDDVVYHFVYTMQQKNYFGKDGSVTIVNGIGSSKEQVVELKEKLDQLKDLKSYKIEVNSHIILNYQTLCV
jgi:hypothetical protein